jgi:hypothetical protein
MTKDLRLSPNADINALTFFIQELTAVLITTQELVDKR